MSVCYTAEGPGSPLLRGEEGQKHQRAPGAVNSCYATVPMHVLMQNSGDTTDLLSLDNFYLVLNSHNSSGGR